MVAAGLAADAEVDMEAAQQRERNLFVAVGCAPWATAGSAELALRIVDVWENAVRAEVLDWVRVEVRRWQHMAVYAAESLGRGHVGLLV